MFIILPLLAMATYWTYDLKQESCRTEAMEGSVYSHRWHRVPLTPLWTDLLTETAITKKDKGSISLLMEFHLTTTERHLPYGIIHVTLVVQWLGIRLLIERSLVRLQAMALSSQLGQLSLPSLRGR